MPALVPLCILGLVSLAYVAPLLLSLRSSHAEARKLVRTGELSEAEILGYASGKGGLWVEYEFVPLGSSSPVRSRKLLINTVHRLAIGSKVPVRYKARFPSISVLVPYADSQAPS